MKRATCSAAFVVLCTLIGVCSTQCAAAESVIVTLNDGKKQIGELVQCDGDKIVVRDADGKDATIPWTDIKRMSNGLTAEKAAARWREQNADKVCPTCHGDKVTACPQCKGSGKGANAKVKCRTCLGTGVAKCTAKGCKDGKVDCPSTCLKLSEGTWEVGEGGLRWRKFTGADGSWATWSERHLGQLIVMEDGKPVNKGQCPTCKGTMKVECTGCKGTGKATCPDCKGDKEVPAPCAACKGGKVVCAACKGTGLKP